MCRFLKKENYLSQFLIDFFFGPGFLVVRGVGRLVSSQVKKKNYIEPSKANFPQTKIYNEHRKDIHT